MSPSRRRAGRGPSSGVRTTPRPSGSASETNSECQIKSELIHFTTLDRLHLLTGLSALQTLYLSGTQVADLASLAGLSALHILDLSGTQIADL